PFRPLAIVAGRAVALFSELEGSLPSNTHAFQINWKEGRLSRPKDDVLLRTRAASIAGRHAILISLLVVMDGSVSLNRSRRAVFTNAPSHQVYYVLCQE